MLFRLFLLQILLVILATQKCEATLSVECIVDYLKIKIFNVDYFSSVGDFSGSPSDCTSEIRSKVEEFNNQVRTKMDNHIARKVYTDCVVNEVKGNNTYENYRLAALGAEIRGVGIKFWKISEKNKYIEKNQKLAQEIEDDALIKCQGQKKYGEFFDSFYEEKKATESFDYDFDYCMRKYLTDKNVIEPNKYGFKLNPNGIPTQQIRCDEIMKVALDQMKDQIKGDGVQECTTEKFISNGYLDDILKIQLLAKLPLTTAEKEAEKEKFVYHMNYLTTLVKSCPLIN